MSCPSCFVWLILIYQKKINFRFHQHNTVVPDHVPGMGGPSPGGVDFAYYFGSINALRSLLIQLLNQEG
jgi:hypothetical protein